ncbi:hypothetical protein I0C86_31195 [Plantactinospora sp. S1510]|uniref:RlpA-like protein double-psi beta-barrel domain-containing protein n=1 Tax=Plantactinospora alkalitolerans TaxID=2789879 RepID=A0ABS0H5K2_9ACTN|nr:expansin EXLX1 family cellulose-binding protein [Plantactinospora alkalitolerans]MBF9133392.1 hypothetical protein [Plantactinospora alkalitolerans]
MTEPELPDDPNGGPAGAAAPTAGDSGAGGPGAGDRPVRRRRSFRWLAGGFVAVLAGVLGLVLVWQFTDSAACAAAPSGSTVYKGKASHYDGGNSGGNCSLPGPPANRLYVALGSSQYAGSAACGSFLDVTGPKGTVRVMVLDRCGGCTGGKIDLSRQAFAKIADLSQGIVPVRYRAAVNPPLSGPLTFRLKSGVSQYWFAVQVGNHGNPVRSVSAKRAGTSWRAAKRGSDNYWVIDGGIGTGPYSIRVVDSYGHEAVANGIRLAPRQVQRSTVRMYGATGAAASTPPASATPATTGSPTTAPPTTAPAAPAGADPSELPVAGAAGGPVPVGCG